LTDDPALLDQLLAEAGIAAAPHPVALRRSAETGSQPLSYAQELVFAIDRATPNLVTYNVPVVRRLNGDLDVAALESALSAVAARHDVLRTRFALENGEPIAIVDDARPVPLRVVDLRDAPASERAQGAEAVVAARAAAPFDLASEHAFRPALVRTGDREYVLILELHHIACDGWSIRVLLGDLSIAYGAFARGLPYDAVPLDAGHTDFARRQRRMFEGGELERSLAYWRAELATPVEPLDLAIDGTAAAAPDDATRCTLDLDPDLSRSLARLGRESRATPYMTLLAVVATLLHRYTGRDAMTIGANVAGRSELELEPLVGYFTNTLAIRCDLGGDPTFDEVLARVRERCLGALDHNDLPYERLALAAGGARGPGAATLFNVVFSADDPAPEALALDGVAAAPYPIDLGLTKFDLTFFLTEITDGLRLTLYARSRLWSAATAERCLRHLRVLAASIAVRPAARISQHALLSGGERALIERSNATTVALPAGDVRDRIEAAARNRPGAVAVRTDAVSLTYAELDARARDLAARLHARALAQRSPVGLAVPRTPETIAAYLGIWKAGGIVVPFEPDLPPERLRRQLAIAGVRLVVTALPLPSDLGPGIAIEQLVPDDAAGPGDAVPHDRRADDVAYVAFTSGSTGEPKGVTVTHGNLANYVAAIARVLAPETAATPKPGLAGWHFGVSGTLAADLGYTALFPALCAGATAHVLPKEVTNDSSRFAAYLRAQPLDVLKITPRHLRALAAGTELAALLPWRWIVLGGEPLDLEFADALLAAGRGRVLNHYGPTETTVGATAFEVTSASLAAARANGARSVPIGTPLANVRAAVLGAHDELLPIGIAGELWIAGAGVSLGYIGRRDLTEERFRTLPELGYAYRTGDRVRRLADGALEYLGRTDDQLKVRGYRVEPSEIEAALRAFHEIADAAVVPQADPEMPIEAYLVLAAGAPPPTTAQAFERDLRARLAATLPDYMLPSAYVVVERLERTANGKLDRAALRARAAAPAEDAARSPRTETEAAVLGIWADAFKRDASTIGVTDDFLDSGGHSLIAIRLLGKLNRRFGVRLPLGRLFENRTIERLAAAIDERLREGGSNAVPAAAPIPRIARAPRGDASG